MAMPDCSEFRNKSNPTDLCTFLESKDVVRFNPSDNESS